ncbi:MAG: ABC transporter ATP-binding protein [Bacilli bacterium]|nr:ABC transporter ATP-binding protein [Bacilli bacterium]
MASLHLKHVYKVYPNGVKAVNDFDMEIKDREFIVFVGPSGCGKSTTLRMIAGLEEITAGELYIDNRLVNYVEPKNRDIAMVFQNYALYPHLTVYENIAFGLRLRKVPKPEIDMKVRKAAEMLGLTNYLKTKPAALSGGQRQRVALGRALVREPKVFLLDEPLSNLDAKLRTSMRNEITKLHHKLQTTFVYVTHDQVEAMTMGDRIVVMKDGFIQQIDNPKNLYRYPVNKFVAGFIGTPQLNFVEATLTKEGNKVRLDVCNSDTHFMLPINSLFKVDPTYFDGKKRVFFALRSEFLSIEPKKYDYSCKAKIVGVEELGTEIQVFANFDINSDVLSLNTDDEESVKADITIITSADYTGKINDVIDVYLDLEKLHLFDFATEEVINPRVPTHARVHTKVANNVMSFMGLKTDLPSAIKLDDGEYDVVIPTNSLVEDKNGHKLKVYKVEEIAKDDYLVMFNRGDEVIFMRSNKPYKEGAVVSVSFGIHMFDFFKDEEKVVSALNTNNKLEGMVYYHKEKDENGKNVKVLDYLIDELTIPCHNKTAYQSFIENNDRTIYDKTLIFAFSDTQAHLDKNGIFTGVVANLLDYGNARFAALNYNRNDIVIRLGKDDKVNLGDNLRFSIDIDEMQVFDKERNIRLA